MLISVCLDCCFSQQTYIHFTEKETEAQRPDLAEHFCSEHQGQVSSSLSGASTSEPRYHTGSTKRTRGPRCRYAVASRHPSLTLRGSSSPSSESRRSGHCREGLLPRPLICFHRVFSWQKSLSMTLGRCHLPCITQVLNSGERLETGKSLWLKIRLPSVGVLVCWKEEVTMEIKALQPVLHEMVKGALGWSRPRCISAITAPTA